MTLALTMLEVGVFAAGATTVLRILPGLRTLLERGVKPLSCDVCMSWWCSWFGAVALLHGTGVLPCLLAALGAIPVALLLLRAIGREPDTFELPPPEAPEAPEGERGEYL